jgi:antitoxin component of MazEF toxin-antitoxin module
METVLTKQGDSLGVRIPLEALSRKLSQDSLVSPEQFMTMLGRLSQTKWGEDSLGVRILDSIVKEPSLKNSSLIEMLNLINETNMHEEIKTDICVGKEIW